MRSEQSVADGGPKLRDVKEEHAFNAAAARNPPFKPSLDAIFKAGDIPEFAKRLSRKRLSRMIGRPVERMAPAEVLVVDAVEKP